MGGRWGGAVEQVVGQQAELPPPPASLADLVLHRATAPQAIREAGDQLVLVDCFTEWCGPCKMILPTLQQWAEELEGKVRAGRGGGVGCGAVVGATAAAAAAGSDACALQPGALQRGRGRHAGGLPL